MFGQGKGLNIDSGNLLLLDLLERKLFTGMVIMTEHYHTGNSLLTISYRAFFRNSSLEAFDIIGRGNVGTLPVDLYTRASPSTKDIIVKMLLTPVSNLTIREGVYMISNTSHYIHDVWESALKTAKLLTLYNINNTINK